MFSSSTDTQIPPRWCVASLLPQTPRRSALDLLNSSRVLKYVSAVIKTTQLWRHAKMAACRRWGGAMNVYDSLSICILFAVAWTYSNEDKVKIVFWELYGWQQTWQVSPRALLVLEAAPGSTLLICHFHWEAAEHSCLVVSPIRSLTICIHI